MRSSVTNDAGSHVVALTDIAATLYCLGRSDEAEKHWLKAVKLCPGYLESTEHLVGLLYRKRTKEAVDIITFVQDALRLSDSEEKSHIHMPTRAHSLTSSSHSTVGLGASNGQYRQLTFGDSGTTLFSRALLVCRVRRASEPVGMPCRVAKMDASSPSCMRKELCFTVQKK